LTHLHLDHVGGAVTKNGDTLAPTFKNATYWSNEQHWNWAIHPNDREKASFLTENIIPLQESGQLNFVTRDNFDLTDNLKLRFTYGHTEAMMLPEITYKEKTILFAADLIPTVAHIPIPYIAGYDIFPLKAMEEKKAFLRQALMNNVILFFEHDSQCECCILTDTEKGIRLRETFKLSDI
jgi:glyoxylase-like metal-dependent hydrolase (beta-lactamase superfamily II)